MIRFLILAILLGSLGLAFFHWKSLPQSFKYLAYYLAWNLFIEVLSRVFIECEINNLPLLHIYTLLEFVFFSFLYREMGIFEKWTSRNFWIFLGVVMSLVVLNSAFLQSIWAYNSYAKSLVQLSLIGYGVAYIFLLREKNPMTSALNLMNAAILVYYSGSLFVFMFANVLLSNPYRSLFWEANVYLNFIFQILIFMSLWKASQVKKLPSS